MNSSKGKLDEEIPYPSLVEDPSHHVKIVVKHIFSIVNESKARQCGFTKADALRIKKDWGYMIKIIGGKLKSSVKKAGFLLNTCLTIMAIVVQSGDSIKEYQKKKIHTTTNTMNSAASKTTTRYKIS